LTTIDESVTTPLSVGKRDRPSSRGEWGKLSQKGKLSHPCFYVESVLKITKCLFGVKYA
jgi:hypothetical protein